MLLTSAGFLKAQGADPIEITVPKDAKVTITLTSSSFTFTSASYPQLFEASAVVAPDGGVDKLNSKTVKWILEPKATTTYELSTATNESNWDNLSLSLDGKVTSFVVTGPATNKFQKLITSLSFTNNGELSNLILQARAAYTTAGLSNLSILSCSGNKLTRIPAKPEGMTNANYQVGMQTPAEGTLGTVSGNAESFVLNVDAFGKLFKDNTLTDGKDLSIETLKDENGNVTSSVKADLVNSVYHFRDAQGIYVDGNFKADIKISNESYPGVIICNVPLSVSPATFGLSLEGYDKTLGNSFKVAVNGTEKTGDILDLKKGDKITLTPVPNSDKGYEFGKFDSYVGVTGPTTEGNGYVFTVTGDQDPVIKASFKLKDGVKVTWNTATSDGEIKVYQNGKILTGNEAALTVGSEIRVYAKAKSGVINDVKLNKTSIKSEDTNDAEDVFDATIKVPAEGANIVVEFGVAKYTLTIQRQNGPKEITVIGDDGTTYYNPDAVSNTGTNDIKFKVPVGVKLTFTFPVVDVEGKYVSSVLVNGATIIPEQTSEGTYVIKDYQMPNAPVKMVVNIAVLKKLTPKVDKTNTLVYTGDPLSIKYTEADNLTDIVVYYGKKGDDIKSYKANAPFTNAGTYSVYFHRKADSKYVEINTSATPEEYTITKAPIVIQELPKVSVDATTKKYQISGGKVGYMKGEQFVEVKDLGKFVVLGDGGQVVEEDLNTAIVTVRYIFTPETNDNLDLNIDDAKVPVEGKNAETISVSVYQNDYSPLLILKNGGATITSGSSVPVGSTITFALKEKDENSKVVYSVYWVDAEGKKLIADNLFGGTYKGTFDVTKESIKDVDKLIFMLDVQNNRTEIKLSEESKQYLKQEVKAYDGNNHPFDASNLKWIDVNSGNEISDDNINKGLVFTYTLDGKEVSVPNDAGDYKVAITRPETTTYKEIDPISATLVINKADFTEQQVPKPQATRVALGQKLDRSDLLGQATIEGSYEWDEATAASLITVDPEKEYKVKFVPTKNYKEKFIGTVSVAVTTNPIITFDANPEGGTVTVVNKNDPNDVYKSGDEVFAGTELIIKATPNTDFELKSLLVNGSSVSNPYTVKFDKTTLEVEATFQVKTKPGNFKVTVPEYVRGTIITGGGEHVVAEGGTLSFTVATASADASKVSVKASNGTVTKGSNGRYTLSGLTANSTVTVSLSNPTALKVDIQKSYLNAGKYHVATVEVESDYTDGKFYYGDEITVVAYPESGVKFEKWSDGSKDQVHDIVLTGDLKLTATFSGTPTGIEDIMAASIATGKGCVWVRGIANADVTIVSISGRVQARQRISGDTRIDVPAGIYVVVLESGSDVKRVKVIVK